MPLVAPGQALRSKGVPVDGGVARPLVAAGEHGVFELDGRGAVARRVGSITHVAAPRFLPGGRAVLVLQANARLIEVALATGHERALSGPWSPVLRCTGREPVAVELQADEALVLDAGGRHVCVELSDRNTNMASHVVSVRADLAAGTFALRWVLGCEGAPALERFACEEANPAPRIDEHRYAFDGRGHLVHHADGPSAFDGWSLVASSPDERWLVLRGNQEDADYIHFNFLIVDRRTNAVFAVPPHEGDIAPAWPAPLRAPELADPSRARLGGRAGDFVGEDSVRFFDGARLVVGRLLIFLEDRHMVVLDGTLAH